MRIFKEEFIEQMRKSLPQIEGFELGTIEGFGVSTIQPEKISAVIRIGNWHIQLKDKTFTEEQIKNMRDFFGWEVHNIEEKEG